jgi:hypothetical protein
MSLIDTFPFLDPISPLWIRAVVSVFRMESIIDVAVKGGRTVKPGTGADKHTTAKPFWTVVAGWCTAVRSNVIVAVGAYRSDADIDADLSLCRNTQRKNGCRYYLRGECTHG